MEEQAREKAEKELAGEQPPSAISRALAGAKISAFYWRPLPGPLGLVANGRWWRLFEHATDHWGFELIVILAVVCNTVLLSMQYAGMNASYAASLDKANNVLSFVFLAEAVIKIGAQGRAYFTSAFNLFDVGPLFVAEGGGRGRGRGVPAGAPRGASRAPPVCPAVLQGPSSSLGTRSDNNNKDTRAASLHVPAPEPPRPPAPLHAAPPQFVVTALCVMAVFVDGASGISALRAIRVLRVLRLLTVLPNLQRSVIILGRVVVAAAPFLMLVLFMYYIFALLGMQLFGASCKPDDPNAPTYGFSSLWTAMLAVFTLGDVGDIFSTMACASPAAAIYYIVGAGPWTANPFLCPLLMFGQPMRAASDGVPLYRGCVLRRPVRPGSSSLRCSASL